MNSTKLLTIAMLACFGVVGGCGSGPDQDAAQAISSAEGSPRQSISGDQTVEGNPGPMVSEPSEVTSQPNSTQREAVSALQVQDQELIVSGEPSSQPTKQANQEPAGSAFALPEGGIPPTVVSAIKQGDLATVEASLKQGQDVHARIHDGSTMLHLATTAGHEGIVQLLLRNGADCNAPWTQLKLTPIHLACIYGHAQLLDLFQQHGGDFLATSQDGKTALHYLFKIAKSQTVLDHLVGFLVAQSVPLNAQDARGNTALHEAAKAGDIAAVKSLLASKANKDLTNAQGQRPRDLASDPALSSLLE